MKMYCAQGWDVCVCGVCVVCVCVCVCVWQCEAYSDSDYPQLVTSLPWQIIPSEF
jgi:hypothetical protein